ncbi:ABC transporter ATP-binding protein [Lactobacillus delbrueckii]|uniref:ABC transporter ATP-binding protein n=1 Tax=Lactobacillus delbrueckii TaxID=1584 RepID=UPI001F3CA353|nr:ABC transporter ATP-binding protein [Lactobacillus delbrueckii]GHN50935.1 hypothetical protein ME801_06040 [Lactobacillus delbrueckii]
MLEVKNLSVNYHDFTAVERVNFKVQKHEFFTLLGPSGCGKSTTLRAIAGLTATSTGQVILDGQEITALPASQRNIGMVFQNYALFPNMTVAENIGYGLKLAKLPKAMIKQKVARVADLVHLTDYELKKQVAELSGGQQQRVAIARALAPEPPLLLLDEPLSNLDAKLREQLRNELKQLQQAAGITMIYVTHDQSEALMMSDHVAVFNIGHLEQLGSPQTIYRQPQTEFVCKFVGDVNQVDQWLPAKAAAEHHYVRPEQIGIFAEPDQAASDQLTVSGRVAVVNFLGAPMSINGTSFSKHSF